MTGKKPNELWSFGYFGGKGKMLDFLLQLLPYDKGYVEPFCGSAVVLLNRRQSTYEHINDLDGRVTTFFRVVRERPEELARQLLLTPTSSHEFDYCTKFPEGLSDLEVARRFYYIVRMSIASQAKRFRVNFVNTGKFSGESMAPNEELLYVRFLSLAKRLRNVTIHNLDAEYIIEKTNHEDVVCYVDPPYPDGVGKGAYLHNDVDHERLSSLLHDYKGFVAISGYATETMLELYKDWTRLDYNTVSYQSPFGNTGGVKHRRVESVWVNRPLSATYMQTGFDELLQPNTEGQTSVELSYCS